MKIINNFLNKKTHEEMKSLLFSDNFPWYYNDFVAGKLDNKNFLFTHTLIREEKTNSAYSDFFIKPILEKIPYKKLIRAKINCYTKSQKKMKSAFHVDQVDNHTVLLYNVNTNNGYTLFKKNNKKIYSLENSLIIFNGNEKHCSVNQTDKKLRININININ